MHDNNNSIIIISAIVSTEAPKIEASTQPFVIPPAPEALPLPELPIPVSVEPPRQPVAAYGARKCKR